MAGSATLNARVGGNGLISLAHQLIAAKLNVANGTDSTGIGATIHLAPSGTSALVTALTAYNEGATGPGRCPQPLTAP